MGTCSSRGIFVSLREKTLQILTSKQNTFYSAVSVGGNIAEGGSLLLMPKAGDSLPGD